ncbi:MAG: hypothetical protein JWM41_888 [Gemmatimonadetes bacterium]|nr:hypothetical protein [Gemmatimonadota bacterium]
MNLRFRVLAASVALVGASGASAQGPARRDTISRAASIAIRYDSVGQNQLRLVSNRYLFARAYRPDTTRAVVLHELSQQSCCIRGERDTWGTFTIEAWPDSANGRTPLWHATVDADEGEIRGDFYRTITRGCCDSPDQLVFFDLLSGGPAFFATTGRQDEQWSRDLPSVRDAESRQLRFVAFQEANAVQPSQRLTLAREAVGVLQYGPSRGASSRIAVQRASGDGKEYFLTDVRFIVGGKLQPAGEATLFPLKRGKHSGFSGFAIRLRVTSYDAPIAVVTIPVNGDSPVLSRATVPRGFALHAIPSR